MKQSLWYKNIANRIFNLVQVNPLYLSIIIKTWQIEHLIHSNASKVSEFFCEKNQQLPTS